MLVMDANTDDVLATPSLNTAIQSSKTVDYTYRYYVHLKCIQISQLYCIDCKLN